MKKRFVLTCAGVVFVCLLAFTAWILIFSPQLVSPLDGHDNGEIGLSNTIRPESILENRGVEGSVPDPREREKRFAVLKQKLMSEIDGSLDGNAAQTIHRFFQAMTPETLPQYLALLDLINPDIYSYYIPEQADFSLHFRWMEFDPMGALEHARKIWNEEMQQQYMAVLLKHWGEISPEEAKSYYQTLRNAPLQNENELLALLEGVALHDRDFSARALAGFQDGEQRSRVVGSIIESMINAPDFSADQTLNCINTLSDTVLRAQAELYLAQLLADTSPRVAFECIQRLTLNPEEKQDYERSIFQKWAAQKPFEAAAWLKEQETEVDVNTLRQYYSVMVNNWAVADLSGTEQWLTSQKNSGQLDLAIQQVARMVRAENPEKATQWAEAIVDPLIYNDTLSQLETDAQNSINPTGNE